MLVADDLAVILYDSLSDTTDKTGAPTTSTQFTQAYAEGIVAVMQAAIVTNAPGTVIGTGEPAGTFMGSSTLGLIELDSSVMTDVILSVYQSSVKMEAPDFDFSPVESSITQENQAVCQYIMESGLVSFAQLTGIDTATLLSPGTLVDGHGDNGIISGLIGSACASIVASQSGLTGPYRNAFYTALVNYIMANASATYAANNVIGDFSADGGPIQDGAGMDGTIL
jgi:hypothetical protein